ncbi:hypothetical protein GCM10010917_16060 [Paenibacillus physcomitrellae]|uniref:Uncharacterized protein n=1 Tax=Paenibacillus physcomitrellae TaxID=1619311 RepID=A0ABQ1FXL7_9BACL|nr:hypothetical protein GCM10010917_16060 [Paenibacillus physcomitrellae]
MGRQGKRVCGAAHSAADGCAAASITSESVDMAVLAAAAVVRLFFWEKEKQEDDMRT